MAIVRNTKTVDSHCRVALPREWAKPGDKVYFDITKTGNLVIRKMPEKPMSAEEYLKHNNEPGNVVVDNSETEIEEVEENV